MARSTLFDASFPPVIFCQNTRCMYIHQGHGHTRHYPVRWPVRILNILLVWKMADRAFFQNYTRWFRTRRPSLVQNQSDISCTSSSRLYGPHCNDSHRGCNDGDFWSNCFLRTKTAHTCVRRCRSNCRSIQSWSGSWFCRKAHSAVCPISSWLVLSSFSLS